MPKKTITKQLKAEILKKTLRKAQGYLERSERSIEETEAESLIEPEKKI